MVLDTCGCAQPSRFLLENTECRRSFYVVLGIARMFRFFSTALIPHPARSYPAPLREAEVEWQVAPGHEPFFLGEGFGDGSGRDNKSYQTRRCGWCVAGSVHLETIHQASADVIACGPLLGPLQEVPIAEAYAFLFFLSHVVLDASGRAVFYTDCQWVVSTYAAGRQQATSAMAVGAQLWRRIFDQIFDLVGEDSDGINVKKLRAHQAKASYGSDPALAYLWWGNHLADAGAKRGAAKHPRCEETLEHIREFSGVSQEVGSFLARAAVWRLQRYGKQATTCESAPAVGRRTVWRRPPHMQHRARYAPGALRWGRASCFRSAGTLASLNRSPCLRIQQRQHCLWTCGPLVFCFRCGVYSECRTYALHVGCMGIASNLSRLQSLRAGQHPVTKQQFELPKPAKLQDEWELLTALINNDVQA